MVETPTGPNTGSNCQITYVVFTAYDNLNRPLEMDQYVVLGDPTALGAPPVPTGPPGHTVLGANQAVYVTTYQYDDRHNTVLTTDPRVTATPRTTVTRGQTFDQYDGLDRLMRRTPTDYGGLNLKTIYTYDADGNPASVTDPAGSKTVSLFDGLDRLIEIIEPELSTGVQYTELSYYDGDNNQIATIDQRGIVFTTNYDNLNRVVAQTIKETISNGGQWLTLMATSTYHDTGRDCRGVQDLQRYHHRRQRQSVPPRPAMTDSIGHCS